MSQSGRSSSHLPGTLARTGEGRGGGGGSGWRQSPFLHPCGTASYVRLGAQSRTLADSRLSCRLPKGRWCGGPTGVHPTFTKWPARATSVETPSPRPETAHSPPVILPFSRGSGGPAQFKNGRSNPIGMFHPGDLPRPVWQDFLPCSWFSWKLVPFFAMATA